MDPEILKQKLALLQRDSTYNDKWGNAIDPEKLAEARKAHKCKGNVIFLSDFTVFGGADNSSLVTTGGVSIKPTDNLDAIFIPWRDIDGIVPSQQKGLLVYANGKIYKFPVFFQDGLKERYLSLFQDLIGEETSRYLKEFEQLTNHTGNLSAQEIADKIALCDRLLSSKLTTLEQQYSEAASEDEGAADVCVFERDYLGVMAQRAKLLYLTGKSEQAKQDLFAYVLQTQEEGVYAEELVCDACMTLSNISENRNEFDDAMVALQFAVNLKKPELRRKAQERMAHLKTSKMESLPGIPKDSRQLLLCTEEIPGSPVKAIGFADKQMLCNAKWKFEVGHPQAGELYVCHPLRTDTYYEVHSFHDKLFEEKRSELVQLLSALGARTVHVEAATGSSKEAHSSTEEGVSAGATDEISVGVALGAKRGNHLSSKANKFHSGIETIELNPSPNPHIPADLLWYHHEPSWQKMAQSVLANRYKTLSVELRYYEDFSINQKRITGIQAELNLFPGKINIGWDKHAEERLSAIKSTSWKYTAVFDHQGGAMLESKPVATNRATAEYLECLKDALTDGIISGGARKILERQRVKLGISEADAKQLELSLQSPKLTETEKEYMDDLQDCCENGIVSDSSRRLLARRREKLGISEGRAIELENMLKATLGK